MKQNKKGIVEKSVDCGQKLKILSDPTRLAVLKLLRNSPSSVGNLVKHLDIEQSLLSHHLKILRDEGFVMTERKGKEVCYSIAPEVSVEKDSDQLNLGCCSLSFKQSN